MENYAPVPPFSLLFYIPFTFLKLAVAKLVFNVLGLFIFCFSLSRLIGQIKFFCLSFYFLPLIFFQPIFSNFHHGQAYLLIATLFFEFYIAFQNNKKVTVGWIVVLLFALKIFPAFIAIFLIFKKDWKSIQWMVFFSIILCVICYFAIGANTVNYYYLDVFPRLALNDITAPFYFYNQSIYTFFLNAFVAQPYLNPSPVINAPIIAVILQLLFCAFVFSMFITIILKQSFMVSFFVTVLVLFLLNKYSTVYGLIVLFPFVFLAKELPAKKSMLISIILLILCNIPIYKLQNAPLLFQYTRVWLLILLFILLISTLKTSFDLKYFFISLLIFALPSLAFYKYTNDPDLEMRPKAGVLYNFNVARDHIKLYTCLGNRDSVEYINFTALIIDSTSIEMNQAVFLPGNKAVFVNNEKLIYMTDENNGVGLYYLKVKTPRIINN
ncbi:MAG: DUF2029 domain-containing protein [Bacteroidetes bacterium]|nr:DUF2029 domain-containing protein [Bacteroidota bacterium]